MRVMHQMNSPEHDANNQEYFIANEINMAGIPQYSLGQDVPNSNYVPTEFSFKLTEESINSPITFNRNVEPLTTRFSELSLFQYSAPSSDSDSDSVKGYDCCLLNLFNYP